MAAPDRIEAADAGWVAVWGAPPVFADGGPQVDRQTIRQVVRLSRGGPRLRLRLSNELGERSLMIGAAGVARPASTPGDIEPAGYKPVTFSGEPGVVIPPGAAVLSDAVELPSQALDSLTVDLFVAGATGPASVHPYAIATGWIAPGDQVGATAMAAPQAITARYFVTAVEVADPAPFAIVAIGDSITDGNGSTPGADRRWTDILAERIVDAGLPYAVVNGGIGGNRVLNDLPLTTRGPRAVDRFDRDALSMAGVRTVILFEGNNDLGLPGALKMPDQVVTADAIIAGMRAMIAKARARRVRVLGSTLTPFNATPIPGYASAKNEAKRQAVNRWIRNGGDFDGVIDFDAAIRDPDSPDRLAMAYHNGDGLHPNDAGYRKMADAIDLGLIAERARRNAEER